MNAVNIALCCHYLSPDGMGDRDELGHQALELRNGERLRAVLERLIGIGVNLDEQCVGASGDRCQ